jgi:hypothetical protein
MASTKTESQSANGVASLADLKARRYALATLPTGLKVRLRSVTLDELAAEEGLPDTLVRVAVLEQFPGGVVAEMARETVNGKEGIERARGLSRDMLALRDRLILRAVVEPALEAADLDDLDPFDKAMVAAIASREVDTDAEGRRVWGVEPLNTFRVYLQEHGCDEGCEACGRVVAAFSQVQ